MPNSNKRKAKSALISAIEVGLVKTSYDYAAIESTLVPVMLQTLSEIVSFIFLACSASRASLLLLSSFFILCLPWLSSVLLKQNM